MIIFKRKEGGMGSHVLTSAGQKLLGNLTHKARFQVLTITEIQDITQKPVTSYWNLGQPLLIFNPMHIQLKVFSLVKHFWSYALLIWNSSLKKKERKTLSQWFERGLFPYGLWYVKRYLSASHNKQWMPNNELSYITKEQKGVNYPTSRNSK